jgi:hypothetical protein
MIITLTNNAERYLYINKNFVIKITIMINSWVILLSPFLNDYESFPRKYFIQI